MQNVIAIDGPAASGKSTIARMVAEKFHVPYINTGNMYRAVTLYALQKHIDPDCGMAREKLSSILPQLQLDYVENKDGKLELEMNGALVADSIRGPEVTETVSQISSIPEVREFLVAKQREFASRGLIVMEGRDIGTVVFPEAKYKFFLTASPEVRARRRLAQGGEIAAGSTVESVAAEIAARDEMDMKRKISPLRKADDAILVDSSDLGIDQVIEKISSYIAK